jgi:4-hydroxy-4-methyl-2-oxoglutarate aldolase
MQQLKFAGLETFWLLHWFPIQLTVCSGNCWLVRCEGTVKETAGSVNVDVVCAGALVHPGDIIVGDLDGIVVVPREQAAEVARLGEERLAKEQRSRERLSSGELGIDIYGLRVKLASLGVKYLD